MWNFHPAKASHRRDSGPLRGQECVGRGEVVLGDHKTACVPSKSLFWEMGFCFPSATVFFLGPPPLSLLLET